MASQSEIKKSISEVEKQLGTITAKVTELQAQVEHLHDELSVVESEAFKTFCKKQKVKDISEYESKFNGGNFFDRKCELEQAKQKNQSEIEIIESHLINK